MCGIAGIIDFRGIQPELDQARVKVMTQQLIHRGPDADGFWQDDHAALGHRRLSIIDIGSGQQPMLDHRNELVIVFNGEIYNFRELRAKLQKLGHVFRTQSDTECILNGYREWGSEVLSRLNGMFAFVLWDKRTRQALLARDRVGKKPLYYHVSGQRLCFASELSALRTLDSTPADLDPEALECYFTLGYIPAPRVILKGVHKLPAAHSLSGGHGGWGNARRYWRVHANPRPWSNLDEASEEFTALLDDAVKIRLESEVPLGAFLSGGVDSSLIVGAMAQQTSRVVTNTIGFEDDAFDESSVAGLTAEHFGTEHHVYQAQANPTDLIEKVMPHLDEPLADPSTIPTWHVCEMARRNVTVALSGDGGDEPFGGYSFRYVPHLQEAKIRGAIPPSLRNLLFGIPGRFWPHSSPSLPRLLRLRNSLNNLATSDALAYYRDLAWLKSEERQRLYRDGFVEQLRGFTSKEAVCHAYRSDDSTLDPLARAQIADIEIYMAEDVLTKVDRMSMASSLEVRAPLLDYRIIEFAQSIPQHYRVDGDRSKVLLRHVAAKTLPEEIANLPKRGFSIPTAQWLRNELRSLVEEILFEGNSLLNDFLDRKVMRVIWEQHLKEQRDHHMVLWTFLILALWQQRALGT